MWEMSREDTTAWMQEVRLQEVTGKVESGTETESEAGARAEEVRSDQHPVKTIIYWMLVFTSMTTMFTDHTFY
jgi:hypothetical protein